MARIEATAPASSANLGPGFDALALALDLENRFSVETGEDGTSYTGVGGAELQPPGRDLFRVAFDAAFREQDLEPPTFALRSEVRIWPASGLGSSASAIAAGLAAANLLLASPLGPEQQLDLATRLDGHPDNVSAALFGGVTLATRDSFGMLWRRLPPPDLRAVVWRPAGRRLTEETRLRLPTHVSRPDAVQSMAHAALLFHAFSTGDWALLSRAVRGDRLHEPWRFPEIPGAASARERALGAGALTCTLSGSGPAVLALVRPEDAGRVEAALRTESHGATEVSTFALAERGAEARRI